MLTVETYLAPDNFGGTGLFSKNFITKGTTLWKYDPSYDSFYTIEEYLNGDEAFKKKLDKYGYPGRINGIDGFIFNEDNARFMNHSETPNVIIHYLPCPEHLRFDERYSTNIAAWDIEPGTEMTYNYRTFILPGVTLDTYKGIDIGFDSLFD